ncbi:Lsr2 family protein [Curtobacterium flaccumfaciens]|uniref:histone-like nucleoid-structuring protein Lsr2 n=1 Tax=Curtobacterium flaccumfaciens TaxID=2035 RepID=UPI0027DF391C|nr:Lsr2 family protein [Curtobacterium flaccumfaciens]
MPLQLGKCSGIPGYGWRRIRHHAQSARPTDLQKHERSVLRDQLCQGGEDPRAEGDLPRHRKSPRTSSTTTDDTIYNSKGRTITFGFDGAHYEIDLTDDNADALRGAFSDCISTARKVGGGSGRAGSSSNPKRGNSEELAKIREWAIANGHEASSRIRVSRGRPRRLPRFPLTPLPQKDSWQALGQPSIPISDGPFLPLRTAAALERSWRWTSRSTTSSVSFTRRSSVEPTTGSSEDRAAP